MLGGSFLYLFNASSLCIVGKGVFNLDEYLPADFGNNFKCSCVKFGL